MLFVETNDFVLTKQHFLYFYFNIVLLFEFIKLKSAQMCLRVCSLILYFYWLTNLIISIRSSIGSWGWAKGAFGSLIPPLGRSFTTKPREQIRFTMVMVDLHIIPPLGRFFATKPREQIRFSMVMVNLYYTPTWSVFYHQT